MSKSKVILTSPTKLIFEYIEKEVDSELARVALLAVSKAKRPPPKGSPVAGVRVPEWDWVKNTMGPGGTNRDSITFSREKPLHYLIQTESGYGGYLELGTSRMPARPYMSPAFTEVMNQFFAEQAGGSGSEFWGLSAGQETAPSGNK